MKWKQRLASGGWTGFFVGLLLIGHAAMAAPTSQPNIVMILADDLGWSDLACYGHPWHRTPNLDQLAATGMRFTNAYSPAPICSAARASLLTGKAVPRVGLEFVTKYAPGLQQLDSMQPLTAPPLTLNLPLSEITIAERLVELDYETAFFGKWHVNQHYQRRYLAWHPEFGPLQQGFQVATEDFGDHPYAWGKKQPADLADGEMPRDLMVRKVTQYVDSPHDRPYFLMVSSFYVHTPVKNRCRWLVEEYDRRIPIDAERRSARLQYAAFVETLDHHVGEILTALDESGQADNTLVVFISDNGGHPEFTGNAPLRGSKWNLYEGGIRVPMIVRWPGRVVEGTTTETPVIGYDLLATFCDVAASPLADDPTESNTDGTSLLPLLNDPDWQPDRSLIWHFPYYHPETNFSQVIDQIGVNDFQVSQTRPQSALRYGRYKVIHFAEDDRIELYDLAQDIAEQNDLSKELPDVAARMRERLQSQLTEMNARRAVPTNF